MKTFVRTLAAIRDAGEAIQLLYSLTSQTPELTQAIAFATKAHEGQNRKSGEPYIVHPILVAATVARMGGDQSMIIAALLHDVVEDTPITLGEVESFFGEDVSSLVDGLTKIGGIREKNLIPSSKVDEKLVQSAMSFRKILIASIKDYRALVVKLCDRLHNVYTLDALPEAKRRRIAEETLVVYAPIAHRLGIAQIKNLLEDKSFFYVLPEDYKKIDRYLEENEGMLHLKLNTLLSKLEDLLHNHGFTEDMFELHSRVKHHYSIYMKMQRKGIAIDEVLDIQAVRILVKTPMECYKVLGILHTHFKPLIARFKDYIALPKENGYQTIHTTLFHDSSILEVQVRTYEMHQTAELGVAAHWKYKAGGAAPKLGWLEGMQYAGESIEDFYELAKNDLFSEEIVVYSPKGDTYTLPLGATALDFAYTVHSDIGCRAKAAYINKAKKTLLTELKSGDLVRIETGEEPFARCTWYNAVKTSKAKNHIRTACNHRIREIDRVTGLNILTYLFRIDKRSLMKWLEEERLEESYHKVCRDNTMLEEMVSRYQKHRHHIFHRLAAFSVRPYTFENIVVYSNRPVVGIDLDICCHPKQGDALVAFYKKGKAIIHHKLCDKAYEMMQGHPPMLKVRWADRGIKSFRLVVSIENKRGALAQFVTFLAKENVNIISIELGKEKHDFAQYCEVEAEFAEKELDKLTSKLQKKFKLIELVHGDDAYKF